MWFFKSNKTSLNLIVNILLITVKLRAGVNHRIKKNTSYVCMEYLYILTENKKN